jgi:acyl-lipid omega-6 desaturase (Delta-12 desaturase)
MTVTQIDTEIPTAMPGAKAGSADGSAENSAAVPTRKQLRTALAPLVKRSTPLALWLVVYDLALYSLLLAGALFVRQPVLKLLCGLACGFVIGRLFIIGHDACHQSLTEHRGLNRLLGRIVFLPSLTPYSLWEVGHNVVHHGYTNLRGFDFVWAPKSAEEYAALPAWRRGLERVYRSGWAPWLYYLVEIWWLRMFFPSEKHMPSRRRVFRLDCLLASIAGAAWIGGVVWASLATGQSMAWMLFTAFVVPFVFWNGMIGFVVYVHHTHTSISWHADKASWSASNPAVSTTVHLTFRRGMGAVMHHIMEHTAHHLDMTIPLYRLKRAQAKLEQMLPGRIVVQAFSWRWYFDTARRCKLYDFATQRWLDFSGRPTFS